MTSSYRVLAAISFLCFSAQDLPGDDIDDPLGWGVYEETGEYPEVYDFNAFDRTSYEMVFPTWTGLHPERPSIVRIGYSSFRNKSNGVVHWGLNVQRRHGGWYPMENALHDPLNSFRSFYFKDERGDRGNVIPLFGQLYYIGSDPRATGMAIVRITDEVPEHLRPAAKSRIISRAGHDRLFWKKNPDNERERDRDYERVHFLEFDPDTPMVRIELVPLLLMNGNAEHRTDLRSRKPLVGEVRKGDVLAARGRAYRVLNVVAPQTIEGTRYELVGWIELAPDPITPTEDDHIAPLKEMDEVSWPTWERLRLPRAQSTDESSGAGPAAASGSSSGPTSPAAGSSAAPFPTTSIALGALGSALLAVLLVRRRTRSAALATSWRIKRDRSN